MLERTISSTSGSLRVNLELLLGHLKGLTRILAGYDQQIEELTTTERCAKWIQALTCYKGIKQTFALTMITEIGDIKGFAHPRQLVSWMGMDIREYSFWGTHRRYGITKHGNRYPPRFHGGESTGLPRHHHQPETKGLTGPRAPRGF